MSSLADDHERGALVVLLGLPKLGPVRLRALLDRFGSAAEALDAVSAGRVRDVDLRCRPENRRELLRTWRDEMADIDPVDAVTRHRREDVEILVPGDAAWPEAFVHDPEPPAAVFVRGDTSVLRLPAVAVVGTRRCTALGAGVAEELGHDLSAAGVAVVSGLALGIDGAAHRGAVAAGGRPIGVVATGLDVVYPGRHRRLWTEVVDAGMLLSEAPLGTPAERWRFPARNRLIAALGSVVVVVESRLQGGSMHTVQAAIDRQTDVLAVPGPVRAAASAGPNQLLSEGCGVVRDAADVLSALGATAPAPATSCPASAAVQLTDEEAAVAAAVGWPPLSLDSVVAALDRPLDRVLPALARLELLGVVERVPEGYQRAAT